MYPCESLFMFASHMIAIDRKNAIPEGELNHACLEVSKLFTLAEYDELLL